MTGINHKKKIQIDSKTFEFQYVNDTYMYTISLNKKQIGMITIKPKISIIYPDKVDRTHAEMLENNISKIIKQLLNVDKFICFKTVKNFKLVDFEISDEANPFEYYHHSNNMYRKSIVKNKIFAKHYIIFSRNMEDDILNNEILRKLNNYSLIYNVLLKYDKGIAEKLIQKNLERIL